MNSDGYNYDAVYVPTDKQVNDGDFRFVSEDDKTRFMDYVHKTTIWKIVKASMPGLQCLLSMGSSYWFQLQARLQS